ncbi:MAG: hypothetical protein HY810_00055 [Candidatus Omnitrophica bacterium]|nr:hypothetical protein [Candidatus Omnitrophota bacterium]
MINLTAFVVGIEHGKIMAKAIPKIQLEKTVTVERVTEQVLISDKKDKEEIERVDELKKEGKWQEENAIFGLPKGKIIKLKLKKAKAAEPKTAEGEKKAPEKEAAAKPAPKK